MNKDNQEVSDHDGDEPYQEGFEKMKRSHSSSYSSFEDKSNNKVTAAQNIAAMHECNICGKSFKNGKALGGHRRSHFQAAKVKTRFSNTPLSKTKTKASPSITNKNNSYNNKVVVSGSGGGGGGGGGGDGGEDDGNDGKHTCYLCKKDFPSNHSLYGHMRSHPERLWRGVCPPLHNNNNNNKHSSSSSLSSELEDDFDEHDDDDCDGDEYDDDCVGATNLSKSSLPEWKKTGKRGRKSTSVYEAAENLVLLSSSRNNYNNFQPLKKSKSPRKSIADATSSHKHAPKKIKCYLGESFESGSKIDENRGSRGGVSDYKVNRGKGLSEEILDVTNKCGKKEIEKHNNDMVEHSESMNFEEGMKDNFEEERKKVKKEKSKGKKMKKIVLKKAQGQDSELTEDKSYLCNNEAQRKLNNGYVCDICLKSFHTFQGLGGHRSIHNKEKNVIDMAESKPSDVASADDSSTFRGLVKEAKANEVEIDDTLVGAPLNGSEALNQLGPRIKDFDLNMPPDDMQD
ncbi:hypothetical protein RIF29_25559 [Crotalaria pallida]|uniref:C2H2-type domain-containing protein n=1 Tax=Crotalaria pallida TaxID=3830 RepID=A0AAN9EMM6_CROPI